jgi:tetratricopeptide (TPR) repeat protein
VVAAALAGPAALDIHAMPLNDRGLVAVRGFSGSGLRTFVGDEPPEARSSRSHFPMNSLRRFTPAMSDSPSAPAAPRPHGRFLQLLFALTIFLSAFLLFQVQPLIGKALLPWFGGTPSVWSAAMLVFQWLLLAGYAYAHLTTRRLRPSWQTGAHLVVLAVGLALLPILPRNDWKPTGADHPWLSVVAILLGSVGWPFFVLSTSGPLLQAWYARTFEGRSPYRLYAISNAGSLLGLLSYPFLVEPRLSAAEQSSVWSGLFVVFAALCGLTALLTSRRRQLAAAALPTEDPVPATTARPSARTLLTWFILGAIPSVMMLATTNQVCVDVAPTPFLWLVPLSLYLLSFILCFESSRWYSRAGYSFAFGVTALLMTGVLVWGEDMPLLAQVVVYFGGSFFCAMVCHGELSRRKPEPQHLTLFFLVLALAGAAGGTFVSLLAPLLFNAYYELHVAILATLGVMLWLYREGLPKGDPSDLRVLGWRLLAAALLVCTVGLGSDVFHSRQNVIAATRNFYGVMRVAEQDKVRTFHHGRIIHGRQFQSEDQRRVPTAYYGERSGIGLAMRLRDAKSPSRIGVVGLGVGTLAAYGRPQDTFRFYELDPEVAEIARRDFTYLADCPARCDVVLGDARLALEGERDRGELQEFDLLAIDAFSGDAIPTHLLTREALALYLGHLAPNGTLAFHVSNRHFDLLPVMAGLASAEKLASRVVVTKRDLKYESDSIWVLLARTQAPFQNVALALLPVLQDAPQTTVAWTDDYCSLLSVLKPQDFRFVQSSGSWDEIQRGIEALEKDDLAAAEKAFRRALELDPANAGAWLHLGNTYRRGKRNQEAMSAYQQALDVDQTYSEAHNNLALLIAVKNPKLAETHLRQATSLDPRNAEAHNNLANLLARSGRLEEAIAHYEAALAIKPSLESARANLPVVKDMLAKRGGE